nr:LytTR family DNA-binding domain-containing protein [Sagittula salina]
MRYVRPDVGLETTLPDPIGLEADHPESAGFPQDPGGAPPAEPIRHILIGAEPVPLPQLRHIQAQEHHVHVTLDGQRLTHRARLSDIVAQTAPEDGIQPHRSWWVARHVARELERDGQKHVLRLDDGTRVPVARSRLPEVRDWLDEAT